MTRHIILWTLKEMPEAEKARVKAEIKAGLEGLTGQIPGLVSIRVETGGCRPRTPTSCWIPASRARPPLRLTPRTRPTSPLPTARSAPTRPCAAVSTLRNKRPEKRAE